MLLPSYVMNYKELWRKHLAAADAGYIEALHCSNHSYINLVLDLSDNSMVLLCPMDDYRIEVGLYDQVHMAATINMIETKHGNL